MWSNERFSSISTTMCSIFLRFSRWAGSPSAGVRTLAINASSERLAPSLAHSRPWFKARRHQSAAAVGREMLTVAVRSAAMVILWLDAGFLALRRGRVAAPLVAPARRGSPDRPAGVRPRACTRGVRRLLPPPGAARRHAADHRGGRGLPRSGRRAPEGAARPSHRRLDAAALAPLVLEPRAGPPGAPGCRPPLGDRGLLRDRGPRHRVRRRPEDALDLHRRRRRVCERA